MAKKPAWEKRFAASRKAVRERRNPNYKCLACGYQLPGERYTVLTHCPQCGGFDWQNTSLDSRGHDAIQTPMSRAEQRRLMLRPLKWLALLATVVLLGLAVSYGCRYALGYGESLAEKVGDPR